MQENNKLPGSLLVGSSTEDTLTNVRDVLAFRSNFMPLDAVRLESHDNARTGYFLVSQLLVKVLEMALSDKEPARSK